MGRTARDNDALTFQIASQRDFWLHVAGCPGSHVIVRNPEGLDSLSAGDLAFRGGARRAPLEGPGAGQVSVHVAQMKDVSKPRGAPPGQVSLKRYRSVRVSAGS